MAANTETAVKPEQLVRLLCIAATLVTGAI